MDIVPAIQIIVIIVLLFSSAFFSSAETAFTCVNKIQLQLLAEEGDKKALRALRILDNTSKMLSAILIGNNIVNIVASALMTIFTIKIFGNLYVGAATGILTFIILVFGEITPKSIAVVKSLRLCRSYSMAIWIIMIILTPLIFITGALRRGIMKLLRINEGDKSSAMTEEELKTLVDVGYEEGAIENDEFEMISNIFSLDDILAKNIMVPRLDMVFVHVETSLEDLMEIFREYSYTRYPVYAETMDAVIGTINMKDVFLLRDRSDFSVRNILREPHFTFEHKEVGTLLIEMREESINLMIVLDEYGATSGMITMEDVLEEIVGEIRDEYDNDETDDIIELIKDKKYLINGSTSLADVNESLDIDLVSEEYDSLGGYMIERLDRLPKKGEKIKVEGGVTLSAEVVRWNRVMKVRVEIDRSE